SLTQKLNEPQNEKVSNTRNHFYGLFDNSKVLGRLNREFVTISLPAFVALIADPVASMVDAIYVARLGAVAQAAMGIAISAQYSVAKLYNDPLLKTSTSLVAARKGEELEASVATAIATAVIIGTVQSLVYVIFGKLILRVMGVAATSELSVPAFEYLLWRALGVPAATVLLVVNGIFRGRGDTKTPLYCTVLGNIVNIVLDPVFIFTFKMGVAGAGVATAISQWVTALPLIYLLNKTVPIKLFGRSKHFFRNALLAYFEAGGLILIRTVAKVAAYTVTASAAAKLGTVAMAAYSLTFNLGFATSQMCESISIAAQAMLAKEFPYDTEDKRKEAAHIMRISLFLGVLVSALLSFIMWINRDTVLNQLTKSPAVFAAAAAIMPTVLATQLLKGLAYSTGGIILGGLDWLWSSVSVQLSSLACVGLLLFLPKTLNNIWISLAVFMATQV
ncbi:MATE family efflux transporter, partial [archaeon]